MMNTSKPQLFSFTLTKNCQYKISQATWCCYKWKSYVRFINISKMIGGGLGLGVHVGLAGGVQVQAHVSVEATAYVNSNVAHLNSIFHKEHTSFTVAAESKQVVAGTNRFLHLVGHPGEEKYTVTVFTGLGGAQPEITQVSSGHNALQNGHGTTVAEFHAHHHHG